ncbi:heme ABC transporter ATP-binding protein [Nocardioides marmoriginsengisoli]|uniref:Heme ABC transporter ATP-binding protein n=1 Tax=Nocardioides marmoriginsengisoli TaxID=661483 RepID=A0A3N0CHR7_9ACTN|nr:heme ABC transporter ATP-binding protein [Nocardioides marmoriginsengisoli]RNL62998.1 heme ABC transporter ATP-binding protein [Nocardioides marmoriginsengisoli]
MSIEVRNASVLIDGRAILDDVSLTVVPGELLVVVGPNGAGKSTLLGVISGDLVPTSGTVLLEGESIRSRKPLALARKRSVQLQEQQLAFGFRVIEVVRMGRTPWAGTAAEDRDDEAVAEAIGRVDIAPFVDRSFPTLSGGEKARTGFARATAQEAGVLLLDEPTAALDIKYQQRVLGEAVRLARAGHAVVAVLHDLTLAATHADRICVVSRGRIVAHGTPGEVLTPERLTEVYDHPVDVVVHHGVPVVIPRPGDLPDGAHAFEDKEVRV